MKQSHHASSHEAQSKSKSHAKSGPPTAEPVTHDGDMEVQIREAAYYRYLARGAELGHDLEDWLQAESQFIETEKLRDAGH